MYRATTNPAVQRDLVRFYGLDDRLCCVVTASTDAVDAHHIWDQPGSSKFEELIPVARIINLRFADYARYELGKVSFVEPDPNLHPEALLRIADRHFLSGRTALGYGCSRLSTIMLTRYSKCIAPTALPLDRRAVLVDSLTHSLSHASHSARHELVLDVIRRDVKPFLSMDRLPEIDRATLGIELATLQQDYSSPTKASASLDFIHERVKQLDSPRRDKTLLRLDRRRAISNLMIGNAPVARWLADAAELAQSRGDMLEQAKIDFLRGASALRAGSPRAAIDLLEPWRNRQFKRNGLRREFVADPWVSLLGSISLGAAFFEIEKSSQGLNKKLEGARLLHAFADKRDIKLRHIATRLIAQIDGRVSPYPRYLKSRGMYDIFSKPPDTVMRRDISDEIRDCFKLLYPD